MAQKRIALEEDPRAQLAREQARHPWFATDGWNVVASEPEHRFITALYVNATPTQVPQRLAVRARYRLTSGREGEQIEVDIEALRADAEATITDALTQEYQRHQRMWFVSYANGEHVEWPMTHEQATTLVGPAYAGEPEADGTRTWHFAYAPWRESQFIDETIDLWNAGEFERAQQRFSATLRGNPRQIEALTCLGHMKEEKNASGEAVALLAEAVRCARDALGPEYTRGRDRIPYAPIGNRAVIRAWYNLARLRAAGGWTEEAIELWREMVQWSPEHPSWEHLALMNALMGEHRNGEAIRIAERTGTHSTTPMRLARAIAEWRSEKKAQAEQTLRTAFETTNASDWGARVLECATEHEDEENWNHIAKAWADAAAGPLRAIVRETLRAASAGRCETDEPHHGEEQ